VVVAVLLELVNTLVPLSAGLAGWSSAEERGEIPGRVGLGALDGSSDLAVERGTESLEALRHVVVRGGVFVEESETLGELVAMAERAGAFGIGEFVGDAGIG
jgi:hypothetical protein